MDIATIIGLIGGTSLVLSAVIMGGSAVMFFNVPGILIVLGGTLASTFIKFTLTDVIGSINVVMKAFIFKIEPPEEIIKALIAYARTAKKDGLIALEKEKPTDKFLAKSLRYLSDGYDEGLIKDMLQKDIRLTVQRHATGQGVFKGMGAAAPAFGMIGTLIGLVQMLANMSEPSAIGPSMAVALLTTLYGALLANLVCIPLADKLSLRSQQEQVNKNVILEATVAINRGTSPMAIEESLKIYLSPKDRQRIEPKKKGNAVKK